MAFFLNSGRRNIEGLADSISNSEPEDAAGPRRAWNAELRDSVADILCQACDRSLPKSYQDI
jgi:hypothetical protein